MRKRIALLALLAFSGIAFGDRPAPLPRLITPPTVNRLPASQPYPCILGIVFIDGVPTFAISCNGVPFLIPKA